MSLFLLYKHPLRWRGFQLSVPGSDSDDAAGPIGTGIIVELGTKHVKGDRCLKPLHSKKLRGYL